MRALLLAAAVTAVTATGPARAGDQPVVVELYTSQGCSSCPPADRILAELAQRDDVLPLALHVDYWDYIGWPDEFADARFTARQKSYARASGDSMIYTPQVIVAGRTSLIGSKQAAIEAEIARHRAAPDPVELDVSRTASGIRVSAVLADGVAPRPLLIQLVPFMPRARVDIRGGENRGAVIDYANIATDWRVVGEWDGTGTWSSDVSVKPPAAILVQEAGRGPGSILGAHRID